jgi:hypothetical protein
MLHVVFMDPPNDAYVATEAEAIELIRSCIPGAVFATWRGRSMRVYQDERSRDFGEAPPGAASARCSAFVIDLSKTDNSTGVR